MTPNTEVSQFVHRANIAKYQKILTTYLTEHERRFVERRLAEEQTALQQLVWSAASVDIFTEAA